MLNSSAIRFLQANAGRGEVTVQFQGKNDKVYTYRGISRELIGQWMLAESQGAFHNKNIKGKFPFRVLSDAEVRKLELD